MLVPRGVQMVANNGLYNRVVDLLAKEWGISPDQISADDRLADHGDSLSMVNAMTAIEDEFEVPFPEEAPVLETVGDFVGYVKELVDQRRLT